MGYLEGLLGGFVQRKAQVEQQNIQADQLARERETNFYSALLKSEDPTVRSLAVSGLLEGMAPTNSRRKAGIRGWMGEMDQSPYMEPIMRYLNTPQMGPMTGGPTQSAVLTPPTSAAMPTTKPATEGGPAPMGPSSIPAPSFGSPTEQAAGAMPKITAPSFGISAPPMPEAPAVSPVAKPAFMPPPESMAPPAPTMPAGGVQSPVGASGAAGSPVGPPPQVGAAMHLPQAFMSPLELQYELEKRKMMAPLEAYHDTFLKWYAPKVAAGAMTAAEAEQLAQENATRYFMMSHGGLGLSVFGGNNVPWSELTPQEQQQLRQTNPAEFDEQGNPKNPNMMARRVTSSKVPGLSQVTVQGSIGGTPSDIDGIITKVTGGPDGGGDPNLAEIDRQYRDQIKQAAKAGNTAGSQTYARGLNDLNIAVNRYKQGGYKVNRQLTPEESAQVDHFVGMIQRDRVVGQAAVRLLNDPAMEHQVAVRLAQLGIMANDLTESDKTMYNAAASVVPMIQNVADLANKINSLGLMGPIASRWREFMSTTYGSTQGMRTTAKGDPLEDSYVSGRDGSTQKLDWRHQNDPKSYFEQLEGRPLTAKEQAAITEFQSAVELLRTASARAHGGAKAAGSSQLLDRFEQVINPTADFASFIGNLRGLKGVMNQYLRYKDPGGIRPLGMDPEIWQNGRAVPMNQAQGGPPAPRSGQAQATPTSPQASVGGKPVFIDGKGNLVYEDGTPVPEGR